MAGLVTRLRPLRAYARSRRHPARRAVPMLNPAVLLGNEIAGWRIAARLTPAEPAAAVGAIRAAGERMEGLDPAALRAAARQRRLSADKLLSAEGYPVFAAVLEAMRRDLGFALRDNQIRCARELLAGHCVELRTGEGKTYAAALAALAAASVGVSSHVITVNEYLAQRDYAEIAPMAGALGLSIGLVLLNQSDEDRRAAYDRDIVYGTNKTLVFDHLRDLREARTGTAALPRQTGQILAIVDEADSVLIDDATVPMILSEQMPELPERDAALFRALTGFAAAADPGRDMARDPHGGLRLTRAGIAALDRAARDWDHPVARSVDLIELADKALAARFQFRRDEAYVMGDEGVAMIDQSTGRLMPDRKWDYGMHQLVEMAAGAVPSGETRTVGQVTQQTYFRQYAVLSGLTGTARECRPELWSIYRLPVVPVAAHAPQALEDMGLQVVATPEQKWDRVLAAAVDVAQRGRAVLIGVNDVREAQALAQVFADAGRPVAVIDALSEAEEASLVAEAGAAGRITVATHMAGRGTDIALDADVLARGGLHVILASAMSSARLERQLYGRAGRKGQPGSYQRVIALGDRVLAEGGRSLRSGAMMVLLRLGLWQSWALARIQAENDSRARAARRRALLREQKLVRQLGYQ